MIVPLCGAREGLGGTYQFLHTRVAAEHPIADAVGVDVLAWMIEQYGKHPHRETLRARRREEVAALAGRGWSVTIIAGHLRVHVRAVHRIKAALASEADAAAQGRLFG